jgi:hypothetical protein
MLTPATRLSRQEVTGKYEKGAVKIVSKHKQKGSIMQMEVVIFVTDLSSKVPNFHVHYGSLQDSISILMPLYEFKNFANIYSKCPLLLTISDPILLCISIHALYFVLILQNSASRSFQLNCRNYSTLLWYRKKHKLERT